MPVYSFYVTQTNEYEVDVTAKDEAEAIEFFNEDYTMDDFGEPKYSKIDWEVI